MNFQTLFLFFILFFVATTSFSQATLREKYDDLLEEAETFKQFKVIPETGLDRLWREVMDSVERQKKTIIQMKSEEAKQREEIASLTSSIDEMQAKLDDSLSLNDTISFLGTPFSKFAYHFMVWAIIFLLGVLGAMAYAMYFRSNKVTVKYRKALEEVEEDFERHKTKSREDQVKLKRELQTALNKLDARGKSWN